MFDLSEGKVQLAENGISSKAPTGMVPQPTVPAEVENISPVEPRESLNPEEPLDDGYILQVGAFGVRANAIRQKELLESLNYRARISPINRGDRILYMVSVVGFVNRNMALAAGKKLSNVLGLDFLLIEPQ